MILQGVDVLIEINSWVSELFGKVSDVFKERLLFLGLQGSYQRGEATESSDIDVLVVLDELDVPSLRAYKKIIATMPHSEKACGFIGGRQELLNWPRYELFQLSRETRAYYGNLAGLLPEITRKDIADSAKIGASLLYHSSCHTFLYGKEEEHADALKWFYKDAFFILQIVYYLRNGQYINTKKELLPLLSGAEQEIVSISMDLNNYKELFSENRDKYYECIINWSAGILKTEF